MGGCDESFTRYGFEDAELAWRVRAFSRGEATSVRPRALVTFGAASRVGEASAGIATRQARDG